MMRRRLIAFWAATLGVAQATELPVREVILFKHGVGFFARVGDLKAGETGKLDFKASDMNDVLKSLTVVEKGGGKIAGLRYDSAEPLGQKLEEFPFKIGDQFSFSAILDQMKGAQIEVKYGSDLIRGQIVSGREHPTQNDRPQREQLILMLDSGEIRMFDLGATAGIRFLDPNLQRQFADYLRAVSQSRSKEKRSVYIDSSGTGARSLQANYMIPMPVWKSSYRLLFTLAEPTLEGWAIVDNTTDEDWTNVQLAVVSGRPVSFISNLYEPKYRDRPVVDLAEEGSVRPVVYEGQMAGAPPPPPAPADMRDGPVRAKASGRMERSLMVAESAPVLATESSSISVTTQAREVGELFEYRFSTPVTVKKSESAMLPFLQQKLNTRKLLIYQESQGASPMNAFEISNSTGKTLDGGPITVYDTGAYAGEALMETLKAGDKRLISYAMDLGTRVTTKFDSTRDSIRQVTARRGVVTTKYALKETKTYTVRNIDAKAKTLVIEHPLRDGYKLLQPAKAPETTPNAYRFEIKLDPSQTQQFAVAEERVFDETTMISSFTPDMLLSFVAGRSLSPAAKLQIEQIARKKQQIADADAQARSLEQELNELSNDQNRLRENIRSLNSVTGQQEQVQNYSRQLATQEAKLAALRDQLQQARRTKQASDRELAAMIEKLEF